MRCDVCGCDFHEHAETGTHFQHKIDSPSDAFRKNPVIPFYMCPACSADRAKTKRTFFWVACITLAVLVLAGLFFR